MAHAKPEHLKAYPELMAEIRQISSLKEKSFGCFYLKTKGVLHFHIQADRLYAHVFDGQNWREVDLKDKPSAAAQKKIGKDILKILSPILPS